MSAFCRTNLLADFEHLCNFSGLNVRDNCPDRYF